ncbi:hypothetical protein K439DRAFT_1339665 [Ramaria rubella]|nr:hypothetical protein K439DRAFT_1339665 [Ramaria rubella]
MAHADVDSDTSSSSSSSSEDELDALTAQLLPLSAMVFQSIIALHREQYLNPRTKIPRTGQQLWYTLHVYKQDYPELFHSYVRIWPAAFDALVTKLQDHPVFHNNSDNKQIPVEFQGAVTLYWLGHFGNAVSLTKVALWASWGFGTVDLCTKHVMAALCEESFWKIVMKWPSDDEKEQAKQVIEAQTCPAWHDGWCMVDGTLVPLYARPGFYRNTWFDCKSNYSLNVQLISTPDLWIINYGVGLPRSQHDATAWKETRIPQEHTSLFGKGPRSEWTWADSAYPIQRWCMPPYKK